MRMRRACIEHRRRRRSPCRRRRCRRLSPATRLRPPAHRRLGNTATQDAQHQPRRLLRGQGQGAVRGRRPGRDLCLAAQRCGGRAAGARPMRAPHRSPLAAGGRAPSQPRMQRRTTRSRPRTAAPPLQTSTRPRPRTGWRRARPPSPSRPRVGVSGVVVVVVVVVGGARVERRAEARPAARRAAPAPRCDVPHPPPPTHQTHPTHPPPAETVISYSTWPEAHKQRPKLKVGRATARGGAG